MYYRQSPDLPPFRMPSLLLQELLRLHALRGTKPTLLVPWDYEPDPRFDDLSIFDPKEIDETMGDFQDGCNGEPSNGFPNNNINSMTMVNGGYAPADNAMNGFYNNVMEQMDYNINGIIGHEFHQSSQQPVMLRDPRLPVRFFLMCV